MMYDEERAARELGKLLDGKSADVPPEDAAFAAELSQLAQHIQPEARFASTLEARLRASSSTSSHPKVKRGDFRMAYTNRMRPLAIAARGAGTGRIAYPDCSTPALTGA